MPIGLPPWLQQLRRKEIVDPVRRDKRSRPSLFLGLSLDEAKEAAGWGQADFDQPLGDLSPEDRVLLYAYFFQIGHLLELTGAFRQLFDAPGLIKKPVVIDLGCGPFTGGLALAGVLGKEWAFDYIGVDQSRTMCRFGEKLVAAVLGSHESLEGTIRHAPDISSVAWDAAPSLRPIIVIVSYLLASPTVRPATLVTDLDELLARIGSGHVTVLYTNSPRFDPNRNFNSFRNALNKIGFRLDVDATGTIKVTSQYRVYDRELRYALFSRQAQRRLVLEGS